MTESRVVTPNPTVDHKLNLHPLVTWNLNIGEMKKSKFTVV